MLGHRPRSSARRTPPSARRSARTPAPRAAAGSSTASTAPTTTPTAGRAGARSWPRGSTARSSSAWCRRPPSAGAGGPARRRAERGRRPTGRTARSTHEAAEPLRCTSARRRCPTPRSSSSRPKGSMLGWRNDVAKRFTPPAIPRSQCFAIDAVMVAAGAAGRGHPHLWRSVGLRRHQPHRPPRRAASSAMPGAASGSTPPTGVFTNPALVDQVLAVLSRLRPEAPDQAAPGPDRERADRHRGRAGGRRVARRFGIRPLPSMSARVHVDNAPPLVLNIVDERAAELAAPFVGVTTDGERAQRGLRTAGGARRRAPEPITDAALAFLQAPHARPAHACYVRHGRHRVAARGSTST